MGLGCGMIDEAIEYVRREMRDTLGAGDDEVLIGNIHGLKEGNARGVYISLVNVQEEPALKNTPHFVRHQNVTRYQQPPVFLNLYLLIAFDFGDYGTSLMRMSGTVELFQAKPLHSAANDTPTNPFPAALEQLAFEYHNVNFEQLNHLWGVLGGTYLPSILYKVRIIRIQRDQTFLAPEITRIRVDTKAE
jgi:hypothetical protein